MIVIKKIAQIKLELHNSGKKIALVPTMGALHEGHLSLIEKARELSEIVVVSIFVNKTQFNNQTDFEKYPKQIEKDLDILKNSKVNYVFIPDDCEIFPDDFSVKIAVESMTNCLCGSNRIGHFEGVALIITKLFNIIKPDIAIFGQKDFQQLQIIKKLTQDLNFGVEIIGCKTIRDQSGLAMSSRNQRLNCDQKIIAANIYKILLEIKAEVLLSKKNITDILLEKNRELIAIGFEKIEYLEIRQESDLKLVEEFNTSIPSRIFIAAYLAGVRLIDNLVIN